MTKLTNGGTLAAVFVFVLASIFGIMQFASSPRVIAKNDIVIGSYGLLTSEHGVAAVRFSFFDDLGTLYERIVTGYHQPENVRGSTRLPNLYAVTTQKPNIVTVEVQGIDEKSVNQMLSQLTAQVLAEQNEKIQSLRAFNAAQEERLNSILKSLISRIEEDSIMRKSADDNEDQSRSWNHSERRLAEILWLRTLLRVSSTSLYIRNTEIGPRYAVNQISMSVGFRLFVALIVTIMGFSLVVVARIISLGRDRDPGS